MMNNIVYEIENIVMNCGNIMLLSNEQSMNIEEKDGIGNIVTKYDREIQDILKDKLLKLIPNSNFIAEEEDFHNKILEKGYTFIVDPIDGTFNFSRNYNMSSISVALFKDGSPYISVCFNPYINEMYSAQKGKGAFLNGNKINVSNRKLNEGLFIIGSGTYYKELQEDTIRIFNTLARVANDYRRSGSAVIDLCSIASGKAEMFYELKLQPWDYAAGYLIVTEAGGEVTNIDGEKVRFDIPSSILATNKKENYLNYIKK